MQTKLIKFGKRGCAPCAEVTQALADAGMDYTDINVEESPITASRYGIMSVPVIVHNGQKVVGGERCLAYVRSLAEAGAYL